MTLIKYVVIIAMFFYTIGFSVTLWKEKNKTGSITVFILALAILITPFFSIISLFR